MISLIGRKFGKLEVIAEDKPTKLGVKRWLCLCSCGNYTHSTKYNLIHGKTLSCRCLGRENDLIGEKFGKLTVIKRADNRKGRKYWECKCDCGNLCVVKSQSLKTLNTKSCGCLRKDLIENKLSKIELIENRLSGDELIEKNIYSKYKYSSIRRKLDFSLCVDIFITLIKGNCHYCGKEPNKYNGIDRVNNELGYIDSNCVSCCADCNMAKKHHSLDRFKEWALAAGKNIIENPDLLKLTEEF
jgi:hypothetical protein